MPEKPRTIEQILIDLGQTPSRIAELTAGLTPAQLHARPAPGEWSANDILAHLRSCGDVWGDSIARILAEDKPSIKAVSPRTWIKETDYPQQDFRVSFEAFAAQRQALLALLTGLAPGHWAREAMVTAVGKPYVRTVYHFAERMAHHERGHVRQIAALTDASRAS